MVQETRISIFIQRHFLEVQYMIHVRQNPTSLLLIRSTIAMTILASVAFLRSPSRIFGQVRVPTSATA